MDISLSSWMMIAFVLALIVSIWKVYKFMPSKALHDDDTTPQAQTELIGLILKIIKGSNGELTEKELIEMVTQHEDFDVEHFWRFNENKLKQLLHIHYIKNPDTKSIKDIHKKLNT
ncbi:hypothetical protein [Sulfurimonas autotrophica]|uniref:Uncharacterized protein n=1 Tax=Sulfurimonas autotrophica (strain ATCC BAA-671 / DSM 16294 / JCM 11897 / OK10) TaxID=563040 RepID=E0UPS3_SULAO|nr:hypothetical protein [Sulfurimonas autotrophica]ADN09732.1 hypothetical protein Saut_1688 [Sulfurimonas autotrophica DSM 16294]